MSMMKDEIKQRKKNALLQDEITREQKQREEDVLMNVMLEKIRKKADPSELLGQARYFANDDLTDVSGISRIDDTVSDISQARSYL